MKTKLNAIRGNYIMKILLKCPTRSRPHKVTSTLNSYLTLANNPSQIGIAVSCDTDDETMTNLAKEDLKYSLKKAGYVEIFTGESKNKIEACNADINKVTYDWDIVVLVSDDMIPQIKGYDDVLRNYMLAYFPDTDGILWVSDGHQKNNLNTISILGRKMYERFGHIYNPEYKSLFCDTEFTDLCRGEFKNKCQYISTNLIRHEHPGNGYNNVDSLYLRNQHYWSYDMKTYIRRKKYEYEWSILIPSIPGREERLNKLIKCIQENTKDRKVEICLNYDNREATTGAKRNSLLENAKGKYMSFVDDDDELTPFYFKDAFACIDGEYEVCRLKGKIINYFFIHSLSIPVEHPLAKDGSFYRRPNHLNVMLTDIARMFKFQDIVVGEDINWASGLSKGGFLVKEYIPPHDEVQYIYNSRFTDVTFGYNRQKGITIGQILEKPHLMYTPDSPVQPTNTGGGLKFTSRGFVST
jgi:hypothetical protein